MSCVKGRGESGPTTGDLRVTTQLSEEFFTRVIRSTRVLPCAMSQIPKDSRPVTRG